MIILVNLWGWCVVALEVVSVKRARLDLEEEGWRGVEDGGLGRALGYTGEVWW